MVKTATDAPLGGGWSVERLRSAAFRRGPRGSGQDAAAGGMRHDDLELNPHLGPDLGLDAGSGERLIAAAVLVPLILRPRGMTVLLTQRAADLDDHAGQISFPGGRVEAGDGGVEAAALREAREELGLSPGKVEILGRLDDYETGTGFCVSPVVGVVMPPFALDPDPREVAEVFELPIAVVLDPSRHERHARRKNGVLRHYHAIRHQGRFIWGATAGMLINLYEVLREA